MHYEYHLPLRHPGPGFSWSHGSWSDCSVECGGGAGVDGSGEGVGPVCRVPWPWVSKSQSLLGRWMSRREISVLWGWL